MKTYFFLAIALSCLFINAQAQPLEARHDLTSAQYQSTFTSLTGQGYRLTYVCGYSVNNDARYAAIFEKIAGPAYIAKHGLTSAQYQQEFNTLTNQGYRLKLVNGYTVNNQDRYVCIFEKTNGPAYVAKHGLTSAQYQQEYNTRTAQGYRLVHVSGYAVNNQERYACIFEKTTGPAYAARHGMTSAQYQSEFNSLTSQGYRPVHVSTYTVNGVPKFAAIFEKSNIGAWVARHNLNSQQYQAEFMDRLIQGYRIKRVSGYNVGSQSQFAAIWESANPTTGQFCSNGKCFDLNRFANNMEASLTGTIVKYGFEVRRGISVIQRAKGPKRTAANPPALTFTANDRHNPASVSKVVTTVATMQLLTKKGISIDAKIYPYLPNTWFMPASSKTITFKELLNHTSGLRDDVANGVFYDNCKQVFEHGISLNDKVYSYQNINYALLRVLVASLDGLNSWIVAPAEQSSLRFTTYVNREIFNPIGIFNVKYKPESIAPTLFYPFPAMNFPGTTYGDWSLRPGSAGCQLSAHELTLFMAALYSGQLLPMSVVAKIEQFELGLGDYGTMVDGAKAFGKGGYFPASMNSGAELNSTIIHFSSGVSVYLVVNGHADPKTIVVNAYNNAFVMQ